MPILRHLHAIPIICSLTAYCVSTPVRAGIGCEVEELTAGHCIDDRIIIDFNDPQNEAFKSAGALTCRSAVSGKWNAGSFTLVSTDKISQANVVLDVAISAAHNFLDEDGNVHRPGSCNAYIPGNEGVNKVYALEVAGLYVNPSAKLNRASNDWAVFALRRNDQNSTSRPSLHADPLRLTPYNGEDLKAELGDSANLSVAAPAISAGLYGWVADFSCRGMQGAVNLANSDPDILLHTCDTNAGVSGAGIILDMERVIAIHIQRARLRMGENLEEQSDFKPWDFRTNANAAIFVTQEMVDAAEALILNFDSADRLLWGTNLPGISSTESKTPDPPTNNRDIEFVGTVMQDGVPYALISLQSGELVKVTKGDLIANSNELIQFIGPDEIILVETITDELGNVSNSSRIVRLGRTNN